MSGDAQTTPKPPRKPGWFGLARIAYFAGACTVVITGTSVERKGGTQ